MIVSGHKFFVLFWCIAQKNIFNLNETVFKFVIKQGQVSQKNLLPQGCK